MEKKDAKYLGEKLRKLVEDYDFKNEDSQEVSKLSISIGVANYPIDNKDPKKLLQLADKALYRAKNEGRNKVCIF